MEAARDYQLVRVVEIKYFVDVASWFSIPFYGKPPLCGILSKANWGGAR